MNRRTWLTSILVALFPWPPWSAPSQAKPCASWTGGWPSYDEYKKKWAHVQCTVCARYGFHVIIHGGCEEDFESVKLRYPDGGMEYAHRPSCVALGTKFKHLQYHKDYKRRR